MPPEPQKFTLAEAFDYFNVPDDAVTPELTEINLERALRSVTFLLEWMSHHGNEEVDGFVCHGLAYVLEHAVREMPSIMVAINAYARRKADIRERKFFPEQIRPTYIRFEELAADTLEYCRQHHVAAGYERDLRQMNTLLGWFKGHAASTITAHDIERKLSGLTDAGRKPPTLNAIDRC